MDSDIALCRHCGRPGSVKYYYLSLIGKVKAWTQQKAMCEKMLTHWKERDHWLHCDRNESNRDSWGYPCKKEVWDGVRFEELSYFWDYKKVFGSVAHVLKHYLYLLSSCIHVGVAFTFKM